jgi:hypothetical protein
VIPLEIAKDFLRTRTQAYRHVFKGIYAERVLEDLAKFCRAHASTFHPDARMEGVLQGRREVWLRIAKHLNMSEEDLWKHFNTGKGD